MKTSLKISNSLSTNSTKTFFSGTGKVEVCRITIPGEVVSVHDINYPHTMWRLGRVNKLIVCNDGQTRGAALEVNTNG